MSERYQRSKEAETQATHSRHVGWIAVFMVIMFLFGTWYGSLMTGLVMIADCNKKHEVTFDSFLYEEAVTVSCDVKKTAST